jgi:ABC-type transporter Mla subunit MlaD
MSESRERIKNILSGIFFIGGVALIVTAVFLIGSERGLTQSKFKVTVLFRDIGGLIEGAPVQLSGVNVGTVSNISFLDQDVQGRRVRVEVSIFDRYKKQLAQNVRYAIKTEGILGEKLMEIRVLSGGPPIDLNRPLIGEDALNVQDLAEVFAAAAESFTKASDDFSKVDVQELSKVLSETAQSLAKTSKGINAVLTELHYISIKSKRLLDRIEQRVIEGNLFKVF